MDNKTPESATNITIQPQPTGFNGEAIRNELGTPPQNVAGGDTGTTFTTALVGEETPKPTPITQVITTGPTNQEPGILTKIREKLRI